jgi:acetylornithine deacetylase/succinyl-diaminopimelate desuccinylase-like protein
MPQGAPAIVLGPGSIEQAHDIDEYVELQHVVDCARIYQRIMMHDWSSQ